MAYGFKRIGVLISVLSFASLSWGRGIKDRAAVKVEKIERPHRQEGRREAQRSSSLSAALAGHTLEKKLMAGIEKTLKFLQETVASIPPKSAARREMLERILNLTVEQAAYVANSEQELYEQKWRQWSRAGAKGPEPKLDHRSSTQYWQEVHRLSQAMQKEFPQDERADGIAFQGALALQFLGNEDLAAQAYQEFIERYPHSKVVGDAYFSLGDFRFDRNDYASALSYYRKSLKYKRSKRYGWALFKQAWCLYNLGRYEESLSSWKKTVEYAEQNESEQGQSLKNEVMRDMIFAFAELHKIDEAINYYKKHGAEENIAKLLKVLAETFADQGQFKKAIVVWKQLLALYPFSQEALDGQLEVVALTFDDKDWPKLWEELRRLADQFHDASPWAARQDETLVAQAQEKIRRQLLYYPKLIHQEAQKSNGKQLFAEAAIGYRLFLKVCAAAPEVAEVKEYLADIAYFQENFIEAAELYWQIGLMGKEKAHIYDDKGRPKESIHKRAAENMLDASNKAFLPELKSLMVLKPDFHKQDRELSPQAKNFIRGCEHYIKWYPEDKKKVQNCETFIAEIYYRSQHKAMALRYLWLIAGKYSEEKAGLTAVDNLLPIHQDDAPGLAAAVEKLLTIPAYQSGQIGERLRLVLKDLALAKIAEEKSPLQRAKLYIAHARQYPKDKEADKLWNNAAAEYLQLGRYQEASEALNTLLSSYPQSSLYAPVLLQLAKLHDESFELEKAQGFYLAFATKFPQEKEASGAYGRACSLALARSQPKALKICMDFARRSPQLGATALEGLILALWRQQNFVAMSEIIWQEYLPKFRLSPQQKVLAYYKVYRAFQGKGAQARQAYQAIWQLAQNPAAIGGEALRYVGEVLFAEVQPLQQSFLQQKLQGGELNRLQSSIEGIFQKLVQLEQAYGQVLASRDAYWGAATFYQLGLAYETFALQMQNPPAIAGIKQQELVAQLQASVDQILTKSREYYTSGIQTSRQFFIASPWTVNIFNALNRLAKRQVSFVEWISPVDIVASQGVSEELRLKEAVGSD